MQCPVCNDVLKSVCSKFACRSESGTKPQMIKPASAKGKRKMSKMVSRKLFSNSGSSSESGYEEITYVEQ